MLFLVSLLILYYLICLFQLVSIIFAFLSNIAQFLPATYLLFPERVSTLLRCMERTLLQR